MGQRKKREKTVPEPAPSQGSWGRGRDTKRERRAWSSSSMKPTHSPLISFSLLFLPHLTARLSLRSTTTAPRTEQTSPCAMTAQQTPDSRGSDKAQERWTQWGTSQMAASTERDRQEKTLTIQWAEHWDCKQGSSAQGGRLTSEQTRDDEAYPAVWWFNEF